MMFAVKTSLKEFYTLNKVIKWEIITIHLSEKVWNKESLILLFSGNASNWSE